MSDIKALDKEYIANTYARFPLELVKGKGSLVQDEEGKEYIDLGSGIAVTAFGIADEKWAEAVSTQASTLQHTSNLYYTSPAVKLAQMLSEKTGMKKVFFSNSGAEANECAIKTARKYAAEKKGAEYFNIITLKNSFHGRTVTTLAATGQDVFHKDFLPLTEGFLYADVNDCENIVKMATENKVAAIMIECVQGEGGVAALNEDFVKTIADICEKEDIILICDEVQCGNGRCGELYCYMNYGISPDIVSTAKGLGGGLPLGATLFGEKTKDVLGASDHGSTFGGNPVCCAGALSIISRIDDKLLSDVRRKSEYIFNELSGANGVKSISGMGLMIGIETEKNAADVINECMANGVLVLKAKTKVRLLPALNIPDELLIKAISVLKKACEVNV
ncbi:MAG: acetylornithine/succinylornithine family transaminase [Clostridia bacterium]|nr:acetylornithine/succinylornithine family transaminase [Clostridia bacterium]